MRKVLKSVLTPATRRFGYELRAVGRPERFEDAFEKRYEEAAPFTMTSRERMYACWQSANYVVSAGIPGAVVECGVWRGGSTMMLAAALSDAGDRSRTIWLYDTFTGMSEPSEADAKADGQSARVRWEASRRAGDVVDWCLAPINEVKGNLRRTGYPEERIKLVKGKVEDTIPGEIPNEIAILRLDTDWYESTKHELHHLLPKLVRGGVLLIDDYGEWRGARMAVDEYVQSGGARLLLARTDATGRIAVKAF